VCPVQGSGQVQTERVPAERPPEEEPADQPQDAVPQEQAGLPPGQHALRGARAQVSRRAPAGEPIHDAHQDE
jgi:hypothetical protein